MLQIAPSARLASSPTQGADDCNTDREAFAATSLSIRPWDIASSGSALMIGAKDLCLPWIAWVLLLSAPLLSARAQQFTLAAPDRSREIRLRLDDDGRLTYRVLLAGRTVMRDSPLGLVLGAEEFGSGLELVEAGEPTTQRERYELFSGIAPLVDTSCSRRSVQFKNARGAAIAVDLAASDQGVAFRYRFAGAAADRVEVLTESTGFRLPEDAKGWMQPYHVPGEFTPAYEDFYFVVSPGDPAPHSRAKPSGWSFPALFHVPSAKGWVLITEVSAQDPYPACHLVPEDPVGTYRIGFPARQDRQPGGGLDGPATPVHKTPWTMPWRTIIVGAQAADIATSTLVTDLAPATRISDVSWIKPGRASWAWWSHPEGPFTKEAFGEFTDFAAEMGWEHTLFDANWWDAGITTLVGHAKKQGVGALVWTHARDYATQEQRTAKLEELAGYGAIGLKADFWCSDSQETMATIQTLLEDASRRQLLVALHGCTLPRGWHRTWPNFMTAEAVLGAESYLYEGAYSENAAVLNTILPFTRNVVGPMDYTPFALSPKRHRRTTTDAHELANSIICTSGIIHYADSPQVYRRLPPAVLQILRDAPARWEETRCLVGEPGRCVVFARRSGGCWFVAGISGSTEPVSVALDLTDFIAYADRFVVEEAGRTGRELAVKSVQPSARWQHTMPPRGGFVLRMNRQE